MKPKTLILCTCLPILVIVGYNIWKLPTWLVPSREELRKACDFAIHHRDWDKLQEAATRWTIFKPRQCDGWLYRAQAYEQQGKFQLAADALKMIPDDIYEADMGWRALMDLQFGVLNRPLDGVITAEKSIGRDRKSRIAQKRLVNFLAMTLQRVKLNKQIRLAIDAQSESREFYPYLFFLDSLYFANGAELNGKWLKEEPQSELFEVAEAIFIAETLDSSVSMDDRDSALAARQAQALKTPVLQKLLKQYPHNVELLAYQIREQMLTGNVEGVIELLARVPQEGELDNRFWRFKGWVHAQKGQAKDAEEAYRQALKLHPLDWSTRHLLAELLLKQKRLSEVEELRGLVNQANALRRLIHRAPDLTELPMPIMNKMAVYAKACGDIQLANALSHRLDEYKQMELPDPSQPPIE